MISGALGTGKGDLTTRLVECLVSEKKEDIVYITTELTPTEIEGSLLSSGVEKAALSRIKYLDGTQWSIEDYRKISHINGRVFHLDRKNIRHVFSAIPKNRRINLIINSLSTFLFRSSVKKEINYFSEKISHLKSQGSFLLFTVHDYLHPPHVYALLDCTTDVVIKTGLKKSLNEGTNLQKILRCLPSRDREHKSWANIFGEYFQIFLIFEKIDSKKVLYTFAWGNITGRVSHAFLPIFWNPALLNI